MIKLRLRGMTSLSEVTYLVRGEDCTGNPSLLLCSHCPLRWGPAQLSPQRSHRHSVSPSQTVVHPFSFCGIPKQQASSSLTSLKLLEARGPLRPRRASVSESTAEFCHLLLLISTSLQSHNSLGDGKGQGISIIISHLQMRELRLGAQEFP